MLSFLGRSALHFLYGQLPPSSGCARGPSSTWLKSTTGVLTEAESEYLARSEDKVCPIMRFTDPVCEKRCMKGPNKRQPKSLIPGGCGSSQTTRETKACAIARSQSSLEARQGAKGFLLLLLFRFLWPAAKTPRLDLTRSSDCWCCLTTSQGISLNLLRLARSEPFGLWLR